MHVTVKRLLLVHPANPIAVVPDAAPLTAILAVNSVPVLFAVSPITLVLLPIGPSVDADSVLAVVFVLALVTSSVLPSVYTAAVHVVVKPVALVDAAIWPLVNAGAADLVVHPGAGNADGTPAKLTIRLA